jgi:phage shock protein PspC (stress-responsive transcriptional regulator)
MRKVTTINLNNNAYQIDDEGFDALRSYLEKADRALASNPDREEILADLEQAIADKCRLTLGPHKTVVSAAEIERILQEMGPVAGSTDETPAGAAGTSPGIDPEKPAAGTRFRMGRLYRVREGRKWAGICQGLAAYADIDVSLVRLAVIVLTVCTGVFPGLFIYFVMALVIPVADTPEEIAAAYGQPFRAQELVDRVKKKHEDFRTRRRERRRMRYSARWGSQQPASPPPGYAARVTGGVLLPFLTVLSAAWFAALAIAAYMLWQGWEGAGFGFWSRGSWETWDGPHWIALVAIVAVYALLAIPIAAGRRAALYYANGGRLHGWADALSGLLWIALVAAILLAAWYLVPELHNQLRFPQHGPAVISV